MEILLEKYHLVIVYNTDTKQWQQSYNWKFDKEDLIECDETTENLKNLHQANIISTSLLISLVDKWRIKP